MESVSKLNFTTYSALINNIDLFKEKSVKSEYSFLNISKLTEKFPLDISLDSENIPGYINKSPGPPAFISKSYYQSTPEFSYNYPPKGPIELFFQCVFCEKTGPKYHEITCKRPFDSSLILTKEGGEKYDYSEGSSYKLVVKKRGQRKVASSSIKSEIFSDNLELIYENKNKNLTALRVAKNGSINIISNNWDSIDLPEKVLDKINKCDSLNVSEYQKVYPGKTKLEIDPEISYNYLISAQFNLYPETEKELYYINLEVLNNSLWNSTSLVKKTIGKDTVFMTDTGSYIVTKYRYNSGSITSKSNKQTNPFIQFTLNLPNFKINVMIYKRGAVQIKASYAKIKGIDRKMFVLNKNILTKVYTFLKDLLGSIIEYSNETGYPVIVSVLDKTRKGVLNLYDNKQPQKCQDRENRKVRPVPYSFYGKCPIPGYYIPPQGIQRDDYITNPDGTVMYKREPCCTILTETGLDKAGKSIKIISTGKSPDTLVRYQDILKNGYPDGLFGETVDIPDKLSAVFIPGTKILESRNFKGLNSFSDDFLIECIQESGYIGEPDIFSKKIEKGDLYTSFKNEIFQKYNDLTENNDIILQGATALTNFTNFTKHAYMITPIFKDTLNVLLFFDNLGKSYFINLNKDISESGIPIITELSNTIIEGYLYPFTSPDYIFYPVDIIFYKNINVSNLNYYIPKSRNGRFDYLMYTTSKISSIPELELSIETLFDLDIVKYSKKFLSYPDISGLLYIPFDTSYQIKQINKNLMLWTDTKKEQIIALNVNAENLNWKVSIDNRPIPENLLPQKNGTIKLPKKFKMVDGDMILFKINFNMIDYTINGDKPLIPLEKIDYKINDYSDVINILDSIKNPISKNVLKDIENIRYPETIGFTYKTKYYMLTDVNEPLKVI